jgi:hypothetical protein
MIGLARVGIGGHLIEMQERLYIWSPYTKYKREDYFVLEAKVPASKFEPGAKGT